jgi:hypothetical protein
MAYYKLTLRALVYCSVVGGLITFYGPPTGGNPNFHKIYIPHSSNSQLLYPFTPPPLYASSPLTFFGWPPQNQQLVSILAVYLFHFLPCLRVFILSIFSHSCFPALFYNSLPTLPPIMAPCFVFVFVLFRHLA